MDPTLEKEEGFQFQTSQGMNGKTGVPGGKLISRMQCKPYDINLDEGFTAIKAQENKQTNKRERDTDAQTLSHNRTIYALIQYYGRLQ